MEKILIVNTAGLGVGGISTHMINYLDRLKGQYQFTVIVTVLYDQTVLDALEKLGCRLVKLPNRKKETLAYIWQLKALMKKGSFDVVHVHGNSATMGLELILAASANIRGRIVHCHNSQCEYVLLNKVMRPVFQRLYTEAIACSDLAGNWLYREGKFLVLNNAIDTCRFTYREDIRKKYRQELLLDDDTILLGHVGGINKQKNHTFLISLFAYFQRTRKARLVCIGDGPQRAEAEQLAKTLGIADMVYFLGVKNDVENWFQAMDVFVFPSLWEGLPFALVEAQAASLPCLVSDRVTQQIKCLESFVQKDIDDGIASWSQELEKIIDAGYERRDVRTLISAHGFDMEHEAQRLKEIYDKYKKKE